MNVTIRATKTSLTAAIEGKILEKLKALERFLKEEHKVHVEVDVETTKSKGTVYRAEIDIRPHGYFADASGSDWYEALDLVIPKIREQMIKAKEKTLSKVRRQRKRG